MLALLKRLGGTKNLLQDCSNWETALQIQQEQAAIKEFFLVSFCVLGGWVEMLGSYCFENARNQWAPFSQSRMRPSLIHRQS